jgi:hypothetical protein
LAPPLDGLVQWVKGDVGVSQTDAPTRVSNWADQSGHSQDFTQPNAGGQPYILGDSIDGIPVITFGAGIDANKSFVTAANFKDRFGVDMDGGSPRTIFCVIKPDQSGAFGNRTGGILWNGNTWDSYFFIDPDGIIGPAGNGYAWMRTPGDFGNANVFTPTASYASTPTLSQHFSNGRPDLEFRINNVINPLTPATMFGAAGAASPATFSDSGSLAFLGGVSEILVWDYDLRTNPTALAQANAYIQLRYPSISI